MVNEGLGLTRTPSVKFKTSFKSLFKPKTRFKREDSSNLQIADDKRHNTVFAKPKSLNSNSRQTSIGSLSNKSSNKNILFHFNECEISVYKSSTASTSIHQILKSQSSSILSKGRFQIYEIESSELKYMVCGDVIHPIFASAKFIKVSINTFILPIKNPPRYWKLSLNTFEQDVIREFEVVLKDMCHFQVDEIDFELESPFTSFLENDGDFSQENGIRHQPHLYQPIPTAATDTSSRKSSLLLLNEDSVSLSIYSIGKELENDIDDDLMKDEDIDEDQIDMLLNPPTRRANANKDLRNRYSLTFKSIDSVQPMAIEVFNKYGTRFKDILQDEESQQGFSKFLFG